MNALAEEVTVKLSPNKLPDELLATDRILLRWARSVGDGMQDPAWYEYVRSQCDALPDEVAIIVDQLVLRSCEHRLVTELWYRSPQPREIIARRIGVGNATVYIHWHGALYYFRRFFEMSPNSTLRRLAEADVRQHLRYVQRCMVRSQLNSSER